ncbi:acetate kinase [Patescibacteria group bacterium]|nr:acetate kinase [Patescibacteria group bacterium]
MNVLVINCGSSSMKYQLIHMEEGRVLAKGLLEEIGKANSSQIHYIREKTIKRKDKVADYKEGLKKILELLLDGKKGAIKDTSEISAVGHRVVHGGEEFFESTLITKKVIEIIKSYSSLAPLHNPPNLAGIEAARNLLPEVPQVAVFDTAFHQTIPPKASLYALPYKYYEKYKIRRYGFHGTSHHYVANQAAKFLKKPLKELKIITCHLGNGCSITAIDKGKSIDTSMGFTPLEGLVMGTRCGDIDPAAVLFLMEKENFTIPQINDTLNKQSGLLGISGIRNDLREIQRWARKGNQRAKLALEIFIYRIKKYIGTYSAVLGGLDILIFCAGIGENEENIRSRTCQGLEFLGIHLDKRKNKVPSKVPRFISTESSLVKVLVIPTNEEKMIAKETWQIVGKLSP